MQPFLSLEVMTYVIIDSNTDTSLLYVSLDPLTPFRVETLHTHSLLKESPWRLGEGMRCGSWLRRTTSSKCPAEGTRVAQEKN
jgi:hypothetical protein